MRIVEHGHIESSDQIIALAVTHKRIVIPKKVEYLTDWWKCEDEDGEFLYVGTPDSFAVFQQEFVVTLPPDLVQKVRNKCSV